jgi:hypothetical protein
MCYGTNPMFGTHFQDQPVTDIFCFAGIKKRSERRNNNFRSPHFLATFSQYLQKSNSSRIPPAIAFENEGFAEG